MSFKILCWNVEGLCSKFSEPGFLQYLADFEVCCLMETFTSDDFDSSVHFKDCHVIHSPALKLSHRGRRSGGVLVVVRKSLRAKISQIVCEKDNTVIFRLKFSHPAQDLIVICVYIPPKDSPYYKNKSVKCNITMLEEELFRLQTEYPSASLLICGDFNARTGDWNLHCEQDDDQDMFSDVCSCHDYVFHRRSQDSGKNHFGDILINLCKMYHLCILNGSVGDDRSGHFTNFSQHGCSVIDYGLLRVNSFNLPINLRVGTQTHSSHMPIEIGIGAHPSIGFKANQTETVCKLIWNPDRIADVKANVETNGFKDSIEKASELIVTDIDSALNMFVQTLLLNAAPMQRTIVVKSGAMRNRFTWFDSECRHSKWVAKEALRIFRKSGSRSHRERYVHLRNQYKTLLRQKKSVYYKTSCETLLSSIKDSSKFWSLVKKAACQNMQQSQIVIEQWRCHFQRLFTRNIRPGVLMETSPYIVHDELDAPISEAEVRCALARMSSTKAPGLDDIPGGYLKLCGGKIIPFLTDLFRKIYDTQYFPRSWSQSIIIPIYKAGDKSDPMNYRGISLLSNISKLFMSILTNRLRMWAEEENKFSYEQAGFRMGHSTTDHIFTLHSIALKTVYGEGRGKLYAAFVDFEKAFDSVDRSCLWMVLGKLGLSTKFLSMLKAVYSQVEACVRSGGIMSDTFNCPVGVKQGSVESPLIFCLYISYVADFIRANGKHGVQLLPGTQELFCLLFADDIVLLSTTPIGLQRQLDSLNTSSHHLGLNVNRMKTKVMVFRRGGFLGRRERWTVDGQNLEVVNQYRYLGFVFTTKLSMSKALDSQIVKAKQKTLHLLRTMRNLHTQSATVFFKLYDAQILPTLLYASPIWGWTRRENVEVAHVFACKRFLSVDSGSPNCMCYGELGRYPVFIAAILQAAKYWLRLCNMSESRIPKQAYLMLMKSNISEGIDWARSVAKCLSELGFGYIWTNGGTANERGFLKSLKQRLRDCYLQEWNSKLGRSSRFDFFKSFKTSFQCEPYLSYINVRKFRDSFIRFRLGCNSLKINARPNKEACADTKCPVCQVIENESHFLIHCKMYDDIRQKYLSRHIDRSIFSSVTYLFTGKEVQRTRDVAMFIFYAFRRRKEVLSGYNENSF